MGNSQSFKKKLATVSRLWGEQKYDSALDQVEGLLKVWPGNAHLLVLQARLIQLQEDSRHELCDAKRALQDAISLEPRSPEAAFELGYFLDNVEDDPQAASKAFAQGVASARELLIDGLIGQAKALHQLEKRDAVLRCLMEIFLWVQLEDRSENIGKTESETDFLWLSYLGHRLSHMKSPRSEQIGDLLKAVIPNGSMAEVD